ncbi:hypothetical protein JZ751_025070 [Albula glossodonta]|uniref:OPA1 n=1 Tax=Albula glossodonta TaxID=121402 RepID=A0A8T2PGC6_9TELE|nr:hypothetical protein JZ751_025070 [Albula glossodonta]
MLRAGTAVACVACRKLGFASMGVRVPLQKPYPLFRTLHHRCSVPPRTALRSTTRHFTSLSRLPPLPARSRRPPPLTWQQQRSFWIARVASRLLKLRYILLGSAVGGGYTAKKTYEEWKDMLPDLSEYTWIVPDFIWELNEHFDLEKIVNSLPEPEELAKILPDLEKIAENFTFLRTFLSSETSEEPAFRATENPAPENSDKQFKKASVNCALLQCRCPPAA